MVFYAYILRSLSYGTYYYGSTNDLEKRLNEHNKGQVKYTKARRPWFLHYSEIYNTRSEAQKREYYYKSIDGYKFLKDHNII